MEASWVREMMKYVHKHPTSSGFFFTGQKLEVLVGGLHLSTHGLGGQQTAML